MIEADIDRLDYDLDGQVGFLLRQVHQRHTLIFAKAFADELTATQWAALSKLHAVGPCSQNHLGRLTAMDVATIKGVVERLMRRGYVTSEPDLVDRRRLVVAITQAGRETFERLSPVALRVSEDTLAPLAAKDRGALLRLLRELR